LSTVYYGEGLFVAAGTAGTAALSRDGSLWALQGVPAGAGLRGVASAEGQYVLVGQSGLILQSLDFSYGSWLAVHFAAVALAGRAIVGPGSGPAGCGVTNLMR